MSREEIIEKLLSLDIIIKIGSEYHITEKYKKVLHVQVKRTKSKKEDKEEPVELPISAVGAETRGWPDEIFNQKGRSRCGAFMNYCDVPMWSTTEEPYRIRGCNKESMKVLDLLVEDETIAAKAVLDVIRNYYNNVKSPKGFKNFVVYDLLDLYQEHQSGNAIPKQGGVGEDLGKPGSEWH